MARLPRVDLPGETYLVLQRLRPGRELLLADEQGRQRYMTVLAEILPASGVDLYAYAFGTDRAYLLLSPHTSGGVGRLVQAHGRRFVAWANRHFGWESGLWQGRFSCAPVDPAWVLRVMRFMEAEAPLAAGALRSSYPHHIGIARDRWLETPPAYWELGNTPFDREAAYRRWCDEGTPRREREQMAYAAAHGWVIGEDAYRQALSEVTDRPLAPRRRGRPRKTP